MKSPENRPSDIVTLGEEVLAIASGTFSILFAQFAVVDYGRGDVPHVLAEAVGTILGVGLSAVLGKETFKNLRMLNSRQAN